MLYWRTCIYLYFYVIDKYVFVLIFIIIGYCQAHHNKILQLKGMWMPCGGAVPWSLGTPDIRLTENQILWPSLQIQLYSLIVVRWRLDGGNGTSLLLDWMMIDILTNFFFERKRKERMMIDCSLHLYLDAANDLF